MALSRCKTLEGLVLSAPLSAKAVISDRAVDRFTEEARRNEPDEDRFHSLQRTYFHELLSGLFDFRPLEQSLQRYVRLIDEHLYKLYPKQLAAYKAEAERFHEKVVIVAQKFGMQYNKELKKQLNTAKEELNTLFLLKDDLLAYVIAHGFRTAEYLI